MNLGQIASSIYKRTKQDSTRWGTSGADLVIALNAANEHYLGLVRDKTDNFFPTAWTTTDLSTGTATPAFDALFHELIAIRVIWQYWLTNDPALASQILQQELVPKETQFLAFYFARSYRIVTVTIATGIFNRKNHGLQVNDRIIFSTSGALPTGITAQTWYYVVSISDDDNFTVSATKSGTAIATSGSQSGTHWYASDVQQRITGGYQNNR